MSLLRPALIDVSLHRKVDDRDVFDAVGEALRFGGQHHAGSARFDAQGFVGLGDTLDAYHRHMDGEVIRRLTARAGGWRMPRNLQELAVRADALGPGGPGFPRDFEFVRSRMFEERRQPLTGLASFPVDTEVPLGARSYIARRSLGSGEAQIYRGGDEFPRARTTIDEESHGIVYIVCAVETNWIEQLTLDWAGIRQYDQDLRLAYRLVDERMNRIVWYGDPASDVYGVLNYPSLNSAVITGITFNDAAVPEDLASLIADIIATPEIRSNGTYGANVMMVSPRLRQFLFSRKHSTQGGTDLTIGAYILLQQSSQFPGGGGIREIRSAPELAGAGPNGEDAIVLFRDDRDTIQHVMPQAPTTLPVFRSSVMNETTVVFAATGGIDMTELGNVFVAYVQVGELTSLAA